MKIEHVKQLGGSRYFADAARAHVALLNEGKADDCAQLVSWDHRAVVATDGPVTAGIVTFSKAEYTNSFSVWIGYVWPEYRRQGVYRRMWDRLVEEARAQSVTFVFGVAKIDNAAMREVARRLGREEESVNLRYEVK